MNAVNAGLPAAGAAAEELERLICSGSSVGDAEISAFARMIRQAQRKGVYPFFHVVERGRGAHVKVRGRSVIMLGANDYLGLTQDPRVTEAAVQAARTYGTGQGGSRFLCGNTALHEELEARAAEWIGKKYALVHATGYQTNVGILGTLNGRFDWVLGDHENHASLVEGIRSSGLRMTTYHPQDLSSATGKFQRIIDRCPGARVALVTDSVFSMSGEVAPLRGLMALKRKAPGSLLFVDEAHGLGVVGECGRGAVAEAGLTAETDLIMGTFSKALASIGGFVATDDEDVLLYLKHHSRTLIFSAALPAMNTAAALAALEIVQTEPEHHERLRAVIHRVREDYRSMGIPVPRAATPVMPIPVGDDIRACRMARSLLERGVFAMPALFPAVPRGQALLRTAYMSTHTDADLDRVMEAISATWREYGCSTAEIHARRDPAHAAGI